jgi:hypothetical protein
MRKTSRLILISAVVAAASLTAAMPALANNPQYIKGPSATLTNNSLVVSFKASGLGNSGFTQADFGLSGNVTATSQCYTKSGNPVNGVPKSETKPVDATGTFPIHNGQVTGSFTISPLSTLTCTGNQHVVILSVSWDLFLSNDVGITPNPFELTGSA